MRIASFPGKLYFLGLFLICGFLLISADGCDELYLAEQQMIANQGKSQGQTQAQAQAQKQAQEQTQARAQAEAQAQAQAKAQEQAEIQARTQAEAQANQQKQAGGQNSGPAQGTAGTGAGIGAGPTTAGGEPRPTGSAGNTGAQGGGQGKAQVPATGTGIAAGEVEPRPANSAGNTGAQGGGQGKAQVPAATEAVSGPGQAGNQPNMASPQDRIPGGNALQNDTKDSGSGGNTSAGNAATTNQPTENTGSRETIDGRALANIYGREWKLTELVLSNRTIEFDRKRLKNEGAGDLFTLTIQSDRISGKAAPNRYTTAYKAGDNNTLSIMPVISTLMASSSDPERIPEREYYQYLSRVKSWSIAKNKLELHTTDSGNRPAVLVYEY